MVEGLLSATVAGVVQRVNKLVAVSPLRSRYVAELGDVVVGRVSEVAMKRWKVDIAAQQDSVLQLSAVNLPGGIQVRLACIAVRAVTGRRPYLFMSQQEVSPYRCPCLQRLMVPKLPALQECKLLHCTHSLIIIIILFSCSSLN